MTKAIHFEHISKFYKQGLRRSAWRYLLPGGGRKRLEKMSRTALREQGYFWALDDVSFTVKRGEVLGIVGANGAGKTTILSLLAGITEPAKGRIQIEGRLAALIQLGAGFHPELTGRENIYLSASILGLSRQEIDERFDEIVDFAELPDFIDTPVKRYSSGMYARLGFSVAVHIRPDVLLVDEVLAVGDLAFRNKCHRYMNRLASEDRAIVIVSHTMSMLNSLCDRVIWLDQGQIRMDGNSLDVISAYTNWMNDRSVNVPKANKWTGRGGNGAIVVKELRILDAEDNPTTHVEHGDPLVIALAWEAKQTITDPAFEIYIRDAASSTHVTTIRPPIENFYPLQPGTGHARFQLPEILLAPRKYFVGFSIRSATNDLETYDSEIHTEYMFTVKPSEAYLAARHIPWQLDWFIHPANFSLTVDT